MELFSTKTREDEWGWFGKVRDHCGSLCGTGWSIFSLPFGPAVLTTETFTLPQTYICRTMKNSIISQSSLKCRGDFKRLRIL